MKKVLMFETNFFGVIEVTQAFIDLLRQSPEPRIVNVTSGLGSLALHNDPARSWQNLCMTHKAASIEEASKAK